MTLSDSCDDTSWQLWWHFLTALTLTPVSIEAFGDPSCDTAAPRFAFSLSASYDKSRQTTSRYRLELGLQCPPSLDLIGPTVSSPGQSHEAKASTSTDEEVRRIAQFFRWARLTTALSYTPPHHPPYSSCYKRLLHTFKTVQKTWQEYKLLLNVKGNQSPPSAKMCIKWTFLNLISNPSKTQSLSHKWNYLQSSVPVLRGFFFGPYFVQIIGILPIFNILCEDFCPILEGERGEGGTVGSLLCKSQKWNWSQMHGYYPCKISFPWGRI